jgi:probable F420-dependent oxidoreductase
MKKLDGVGVWSAGLRYGDASAAADAAAELEASGYSALWVPDVGGDLFGAVGNLLGATSSVTIATGILNLWLRTAEETAQHYHDLTGTHGERFLVGIGISHAPFIDVVVEAGAYKQPLAKTREYLDAIDATANPVPADARVLAALGPKMLELSRTRAGGAHPYLATPEHTAVAREVLGEGPLLAPEQGVVLDADPSTARATARLHLAGYLALPNYANNWKRLGFTDEDTAAGGSDRLVDALVAWGDEETVMKRVAEHHAAGADHVCIQVLTDSPAALPLDLWRRLAPG